MDTPHNFYKMPCYFLAGDGNINVEIFHALYIILRSSLLKTVICFKYTGVGNVSVKCQWDHKVQDYLVVV